MSDGPAFPLTTYPVHLGTGATVTRLEEFTGDPAWYGRYSERTAADGAEGRLVSLHTFTAPWTDWEVHPWGEELVLCTSGAITLHQETDDGVRTIELVAGEAAINPPGVWHTADIEDAATVVFITAGLHTRNRDR